MRRPNYVADQDQLFKDLHSGAELDDVAPGAVSVTVDEYLNPRDMHHKQSSHTDNDDLPSPVCASAAVDFISKFWTQRERQDLNVFGALVLTFAMLRRLINCRIIIIIIILMYLSGLDKNSRTLNIYKCVQSVRKRTRIYHFHDKNTISFPYCTSSGKEDSPSRNVYLDTFGVQVTPTPPHPRRNHGHVPGLVLCKSDVSVKMLMMKLYHVTATREV